MQMGNMLVENKDGKRCEECFISVRPLYPCKTFEIKFVALCLYVGQVFYRFVLLILMPDVRHLGSLEELFSLLLAQLIL